MKRAAQAQPFTLVVLCAVLASGCATTVSASSCRPGDSTVTCCIKNFPLSPAESCAASPEEILKTLAFMEAAFQAEEYIEDEDIDDFANNAHLPEWKQQCIKGFVDCQNKGWMGNCYQCLRFCEGQRAWPIQSCKPRGKR
ncbi:hypothetical protein P2318_33910 [Myxococcaceae bacterium GXIMD 01537]